MDRATRLHALHSQTKRSQERIKRLDRFSNRFSWVSVAILFGGIPLSGILFYFWGAWPLAVCLIGTIVLFTISFRYNNKINKSIARHQTWLRIKSEHIARMTLDWDHIPVLFPHEPQYDHPFETDLDIIGDRSLHQLVDTAVSYEGSLLLRTWLADPAPDPKQTLRRQQLVHELSSRALFRDKLTLKASSAASTGKTWNASKLLAWLERHNPETSLRRWLILLSTLVGLTIILLILDLFGPLPTLWPVTLLIYILFAFVKSATTSRAFDEAMELESALRELRAVFQHLETFSYRKAPHLKAFCAPFMDRMHRPSKYLTRVTRVISAMSIRSNPLIWFVVNALIPWDVFFAYLLNRYKADMAQHAPVWMNVWFEIEALSSLANLAYLNSSYSFPKIVGDGGQEQPFVFHAEGLGHPLIVEEEKVCNDFSITGLGEISIITGSNMAGKSVFLRTVGINLALAYAGGPVSARAFQTVPFRLFTCIRVSDSVTNGISYFYAEVKRLKLLLSELERGHPFPLFFFVDEIFRGTNNRERLIGSRSYVGALVGKQGVGLIATHDLELAQLADEMSQVSNYHFKDDICNGIMVFDYTLRLGPCPTTNALRIMQREGLPVQLDGEQVHL